jgi:hypothetical protein
MYQLMMWIPCMLRKWTVVSHRNINMLVYKLAWCCMISKYHLHAYKLFGKRKKGWLVYYRGCRCAEGRCVWDNGEKKWWRRVELRCFGALAREVAKWRRCWVMGRVVKIEIIFYYSGGWESDDPWRVVGNGGADSMLQFQFKREGDVTKRYRKMKQMHQSHLNSMGRKRDTTRRCGDIGRRRGDAREGKGRRRRQLGWHKFY